MGAAAGTRARGSESQAAGGADGYPESGRRTGAARGGVVSRIRAGPAYGGAGSDAGGVGAARSDEDVAEAPAASPDPTDPVLVERVLAHLEATMYDTRVKTQCARLRAVLAELKANRSQRSTRSTGSTCRSCSQTTSRSEPFNPTEENT